MSKVLDNFAKDGYIYLQNYFDHNEMEILDKEYQLLIRRAKNILSFAVKNNISLKEFYQQNPNELVVVSEISTPLKVCRFEYIAACSKLMSEIAVRKLENLISEIMGQQFILFKDKCNIKEPGGGAFPPHQDIAAYFHFKPKFHITAALMLDNSNIQNGCLEMATNYQDFYNEAKDQLIKTFIGNLPILNFEKGGKSNGNIEDIICKKLSWQPIEANIGDVILFHSFIPHCSKANISPYKRRNLFFTFNLQSEGDFYQEYYEIKKQDYSNPIFHVSTPTSHDEL